MKKRVLIVEDDKFFRFAIKKAVSWEKYGFTIAGEAVHGAAALEYLKEHSVEVVVTDMSMPVMNGIELTAFIRETYPEILVIALSAYDDFEFVRESLKLGASDYILKQDIEKEDVGQIIQRAWEKHLEGLLSQEPLNREFMDVLINGKSDCRAETYIRFCLEGQWGFYLCRVRNLNEEWKNEECRKQVWMEESLLELHSRKEHLLLFSVKKEHSQKLQLEDRSRKLSILGDKLKEERFLGAVSGWGREEESLPERVRETSAVQEMAKCVKKQRLLLWEDVRPALEKREKEYQADPECFRNIQSLEEAEEALDTLTETLSGKVPSEESVQENYLLFLNAVARNLNYEMENMEFAKISEELAGTVMLYEKQNLCRSVLEELFRRTQGEKFHPAVVQAIRFIQKNYGKDLSLNSIAREAGLNETYLSGIFKKEMGKGVTEYLNEIRVEKARDLIKKGSYKNYEIARMVGIANPSYFSTIFKKFTGMTIQEYRQSVSHMTEI